MVVQVPRMMDLMDVVLELVLELGLIGFWAGCFEAWAG